MRIALTYNERRTAGEADAEFDTREAIESIARIAAGLGHRVTPVDVTGSRLGEARSLPRLVTRLARLSPELVWNLAEGERGPFREAFYPALFEQLGLPHTGSAASALAICLDKTLAKRVVADARVRVPRGMLVRSLGDPVSSVGDPPRRPDLSRCPLPAIVKPNFEGSSKGITAASMVRDRAELAPAIAAVLERYPEGALVEHWIDGIDVSVGWIAGIGLLPPIWYRHDAAIYDYGLKHHAPEQVVVEVPILSADTARRLTIAAMRSFDALGVTGYGRADFRITPGGDVVFLEMNPLPSLTLATGHDELYVAGARIGRSPADLIGAILGATNAQNQTAETGLDRRAVG